MLRTASAFSVGAVVLTGDCADLYGPKTVRATMGAIFRQRVLRLERDELPAWLEKHGLPLYGAARSESLNAAVAASVLMWEMNRDKR